MRWSPRVQPLREGIARGPGPAANLLFVPLSAAGALHQQASQLGGRSWRAGVDRAAGSQTVGCLTSDQQCHGTACAGDTSTG